MGLAFDHTTLAQRVLFGSGQAVENTATVIGDHGAARVLLIHDDFASDLGDDIAAQIPVAARIRGVVQHVPADRAAAAVDEAIGANCDAIVSIGGGSATGLAKIVALRTGIPIIAVPTTFAGSEATNVWGITEHERKQTGIDARVLPVAVVYDALLSTGLPGGLAIASGLNAVAHAVDGFWAPKADPINQALGTEGLRALVPGLRRLHDDAGDLEARELTLYGAYLAAVAFASAGSGLHHKICHVLGGRYNLSHAETHAVVLPYVTAFNAPEAPDAAARISAVFDGAPAPEALFSFGQHVGAPRSLADLGLREQDIPEAADLVLPSVPPSNPRSVDLPALEELLRSAWAGDPVGKGQS